MIRMTDQEVLEEIDRLIDERRHARPEPNSPDGRAYYALKAVAIDIRARQTDSISKAERILTGAVGVADRGRGPDGYDMGHLRLLAEAVMGRWPTIQQALRFYFETYPEDR